MRCARNERCRATSVLYTFTKTPYAMRWIILIFWLGWMGCAGGSAATSEIGTDVAVRQPLEAYLSGHATGDGAHFKSAFSETANLFFFTPDGRFTKRTGTDYIAGASGKPATDEAQRKRQIAWVRVTGTTALARITLDYPAAKLTDYMVLQRTGNTWKIVSKIFHSDPVGRTRMIPDAARVQEPLQAYIAALRAGKMSEKTLIYHDEARISRATPSGFQEQTADAFWMVKASEKRPSVVKIAFEDVQGTVAVATISGQTGRKKWMDQMALVWTGERWQILYQTTP